jgi:hypothetical protein
MTVNDRINTTSSTGESVRVKEMAREENKEQKDEYYVYFMKLRQ